VAIGDTLSPTITFIDDFTNHVALYFLKSKTGVLDALKHYKALAEKQLGTCIKVFRSDNGGEYVNKNFSTFLSTHGIVHQTTVPHTPQ
jgi:transposase InsO family protein